MSTSPRGLATPTCRDVHLRDGHNLRDFMCYAYRFVMILFIYLSFWYTIMGPEAYCIAQCTGFPLGVQKTKGTEKSLDRQLQPGKTLGWALLRLKNCKKDLQLAVVWS